MGLKQATKISNIIKNQRRKKTTSDITRKKDLVFASKIFQLRSKRGELLLHEICSYLRYIFSEQPILILQKKGKNKNKSLTQQINSKVKKYIYI